MDIEIVLQSLRDATRPSAAYGLHPYCTLPPKHSPLQHKTPIEY